MLPTHHSYSHVCSRLMGMDVSFASFRITGNIILVIWYLKSNLTYSPHTQEHSLSVQKFQVRILDSRIGKVSPTFGRDGNVFVSPNDAPYGVDSDYSMLIN